MIAEAFDVMDVGRMAVIADPTGAALCLWEPRANIGATLVNTPGSMAWNDLVTPDPEAAARLLRQALRLDVRGDAGRPAATA